ncbi:MAG: glutathione peroxidase [Proteobacteria bacterium]|nr:glutathione peroxidase [Pseudomonadota bacterium]
MCAAGIGEAQQQNAYDFSFKKLGSGQPLELAAFSGKVLLVVNTASRCGYTPQYSALEALYAKYEEQGLVIVGVPSNDFGSQEPGTEQEIASFCKLNYGVSFAMAGKEVVSGANAHPFYSWAAAVSGVAPKWNFHKYLIGKRGELIAAFPSRDDPLSSTVEQAVQAALKLQ